MFESILIELVIFYLVMIALKIIIYQFLNDFEHCIILLLDLQYKQTTCPIVFQHTNIFFNAQTFFFQHKNVFWTKKTYFSTNKLQKM